MAELPIRRLSRLGNEGLLSSTLAVVELGNGRYDWGVVALMLLSRCAGDWVGDGLIRRPVSLTHYMSIRAISQSLDAPYASIHRYITALQEQGVVVAAGKGYAISNAPTVAPSIIAFLVGAHDRFIRLVEDLAPDLLPAVVNDAQPDPHTRLLTATLGAAMDIWLVPYEVAREPVVDWTSKLVWIAIVVANVRHITVDDELSRRYEFEPTPDHLRRPVTARTIAAITGLSYGTTFRHCHKLADQDVIKYERGGWLLVSRQLNDDDVDTGVRALLAYYAKRITELVGAGLNLNRIADMYIAGRPNYADLNCN